MHDSQHLDEITIPDIEIAEGWAVSEVETIEDCDDAYSYLMAAVASIEYELEMKDLGVAKFADPTWPARARRALKYKKAALQLIGWKRGRINDDRKRLHQEHRDRVLLEYIKSSTTTAQLQAWIVGSGVDRMNVRDEAA